MDYDVMIAKSEEWKQQQEGKRRYQQNLQTVFGFNEVGTGGGIKVDENDPEVKNIMTIREDLDYDTVITKYKVADKFMKDKWSVIANQNYGQIPANRYQEYIADRDTFQTVVDTAKTAQDQVLPLIKKHNERVIADHNKLYEDIQKDITTGMAELGFAAREGTPEAEEALAKHEANRPSWMTSDQKDIFTGETIKGRERGAQTASERIEMGKWEENAPKFYTDKDVEIFLADGWTTGNKWGDVALQGLAGFVSSLTGVPEMALDMPLTEKALGYAIFWNNKLYGDTKTGYGYRGNNKK